MNDELNLNGRPADWRNPPPREPYHLLVIGAGPAGLVAARAAAALGARVALIKKDLLGGVSLNYGCVPSQALIRTSRLYAEMRNAEAYGARAPRTIEVDFPLEMERVRCIRARAGRADTALLVAAAGIDLFFGAASFVEPDVVEVDGLRLRFKKALIATGSRSLLPTIPGLDDAGYLTNETLFDLTAMPKSLLVVGGGPVGCQVARAMCRFGCRTIITHAEPLFLPKEERDAAQLLAEAMARDGVEIHLNSKAVNVRVEGGEKIVETLNDGNVATIEVDEILTGIGRLPALSGLDLEAAGVGYDANDGIVVDDFFAHNQPTHLRCRRRLPGAQLHGHRRGVGADRRAQCAVFWPRAPKCADSSVVHLHRPRDRPCRPVRSAGSRTRHPGEDLHGADARCGPRHQRQ